MTRSITDSAGAAITVLSMSLAAAQESAVLTVRVPCLAGQFLAADSNPSASVLARRTGSGDAFADLAVAPISLTPFDGQTVEFDLKVSASALTGVRRVAIPVRVTYST
ncbi:MAG: hypothetical protein ABW208_07105 [Pyrinomonadaceae bacterium]